MMWNSYGGDANSDVGMCVVVEKLLQMSLNCEIISSKNTALTTKRANISERYRIGCNR
jgi:hypothetical protein